MLLFLLSCFTKNIESNPHWNKGGNIRIEKSIDMPDFSLPGEQKFTRKSGKHRVSDSCTIHYHLYQSHHKQSVLVILSHGFARSRHNMSGWAKHFASWGFSPEMLGA